MVEETGTDEDPSYFWPRSSPVDEVNFGSQPFADVHDTAEPSEPGRSRAGSPDATVGEDLPSSASSPNHLPARPSSPAILAPQWHPEFDTQLQIGSTSSQPPHARARFPSDAGQLFKTYSARPGTPSGVEDGEEKDREPGAHRSRVWQTFRSWIAGWKEDLGWPEKQQDTQHFIGDTGINIDVIRKSRKLGRPKAGKMSSRVKVSSLDDEASVKLARPGLNSRTESSSTIPTNTTSSVPGSGTATPGTLRRIFGAGVDPYELRGALRKLKSKIAQKDSSQTKYLQAKAELAHRRNLVLSMVYAFMAYGAPPYRLEEYVLQLFKVLEMDGRVNYTVACMEISFINPIDPADPMTRSAYTTLVKAQGLDVGACEVAFHIYKDVVLGDTTIEEATQRLNILIEEPSYYKSLFIVPLYGVASALACVWAFGGYWTDMPVALFLGSLVGMLQRVVAVKNPLYANVLEVTASLITSFGARAFSSIGGGGDQKYLCFGAIAQSSIAMILPGYTVLTGSLELQSRSITAGSTRLFYALIYSMLLGYGMNIGSQLWATFYPDAPTSATCPRGINDGWKILLVPSYLVVQALLLHSRPHQIPIQVFIGSTAYAVNYFVSQHATAQVADTASALMLGILGHIWARSQRAFAFAAVVAGIMVLVPGGLAAQGGLITGITTPLASISGNSSSSSTDSQIIYDQNIYRSLSVGTQMMQVAVGLAVGIFLSALVVYPFGRKNNALVSF